MEKLIGIGLLAAALLAGIATAQAAPLVYVVNQGDGTISVLDPAGNTVIATIPIGQFPTGIAASPGGRQVYVGNAGSNTVSVIDTASNTVVANVAIPCNSGNASRASWSVLTASNCLSPVITRVVSGLWTRRRTRSSDEFP